MGKLYALLFASFALNAWAGIHLKKEAGPEVHKAINQRYSPQAFGQYELAFYQRCKLGSKCEEKYGPWDISKKTTKKPICHEVKWFGNHLDCLQKYMNQMTGDIEILRGLLDARAKQLNDNCDMTVEETAEMNLSDANNFFNRLAKSVARLRKISAEKMDKKLGSEKKGKACRQAVMHTIAFSQMLDTAIGERKKLSQHQKSIIKKHIPGAKLSESLIFDGHYNFAHFDGQVYEKSASDDNAAFNECADGRCLPSSKKTGSLVCPIEKKYQGCRPGKDSYRGYKNSPEILMQNEQRCTELLLKRIGGQSSRDAYKMRRWNSYYKNLQAFMVKYPHNRNILRELIRSGLIQKRHESGGRPMRNGEAFACRALLKNPVMAAEMGVTKEYFHTLQLLLSVEEPELDQDSLNDLFHGLGEIVEDDMTKRMGEFALQRRAFALMALQAALKTKDFLVEKMAKELTMAAHGCDQSVDQSKGFYNSLLTWGRKMQNELKDSKVLQTVQDSISIFNPLISGNLRDIDANIAKQVKDGEDATPSLRKLAGEILEKGMVDLRKRCGNLELQAEEAILDEQVRQAYLNCQNETMACYGGFQLNWALCGLYTRAYNSAKTRSRTKEDRDRERLFDLVQLFGVGVLNGPMSKTHLTANGLGLNRYFGTETEMEGKIAVRFVQEAELSLHANATLERPLVMRIPDKDAEIFIPANAKVNFGISGETIWFNVRPKLTITWNGIHEYLPVKIKLDSVQYHMDSQKFYIDRMTKVSPDIGGVLADQVRDYAQEELAKLLLPHLPSKMKEPGFTLNSDPRPEVTMSELQYGLNSLVGPYLGKESSKEMKRNPPLKDTEVSFSFKLPKTFNFPLQDEQLRMEAVAKKDVKVNGVMAMQGNIEDKNFQHLELTFEPEFEIVTTEEGYKNSLKNVKIGRLKIKPNGQFEIDYKLNIENSFDLVKYMGRLQVADMQDDACTREERKNDTCKHDGTNPEDDIKYIREYATKKLETGFKDAVADLLLRYDKKIPQIDLTNFLNFPLKRKTASHP